MLPDGWICSSCGWQPYFSDGVAITAPELANTMIGMDPASFSDLAAVESGHFWFEARRQLILGLIDRFFPLASTYLEIGCGGGFVLESVARLRSWHRIVGSELHPSALKYAVGRMPIETEFVQVDARAIPARDAFDFVGAYDVIEHIDDDEAVLSEVRKTLTPNGGALITVPQHPWLWSRMDDIGFHKRRYRLGELEAKATKAGFDVLYTNSFNMILLPLTAMNRLSEKLSTNRRCNYESELNPPKLVNKVLQSLLMFENAASLRGVKLPVGTSRVVAIRKA
jgi:SAM-dependent methyltransferase